MMQSTLHAATLSSDRFRFVHVTMLRCHNGTDEEGMAKAGPCRTPEEIDSLIWAGTVTLIVAQTDLVRSHLPDLARSHLPGPLR